MENSMIPLQDAWMEERGDGGGEKDNRNTSVLHPSPCALLPHRFPCLPHIPGAPTSYQLCFLPYYPGGALTSLRPSQPPKREPVKGNVLGSRLQWL